MCVAAEMLYTLHSVASLAAEFQPPGNKRYSTHFSGLSSRSHSREDSNPDSTLHPGPYLRRKL